MKIEVTAEPRKVMFYEAPIVSVVRTENGKYWFFVSDNAGATRGYNVESGRDGNFTTTTVEVVDAKVVINKGK